MAITTNNTRTDAVEYLIQLSR
jgi:hypothetical protein